MCEPPIPRGRGAFHKMRGLGGQSVGAPRLGWRPPFTFLDPPLPHPLDQTQWTFVQLLALEGTRSFLNQK